LYRILIIHVTNAHKTVIKTRYNKTTNAYNNVIMSIVVNTENSIKQTNTAERLVVSNWLLPEIPIEDLQDQFGFRPTGSTSTSALVYALHHVTEMLERSVFVRCLLVDFSKAF